MPASHPQPPASPSQTCDSSLRHPPVLQRYPRQYHQPAFVEEETEARRSQLTGRAGFKKPGFLQTPSPAGPRHPVCPAVGPCWPPVSAVRTLGTARPPAPRLGGAWGPVFPGFRATSSPARIVTITAHLPRDAEVLNVLDHLGHLKMTEKQSPESRGTNISLTRTRVCRHLPKQADGPKVCVCVCVCVCAHGCARAAVRARSVRARVPACAPSYVCGLLMACVASWSPHVVIHFGPDGRRPSTRVTGPPQHVCPRPFSHLCT